MKRGRIVRGVIAALLFVVVGLCLAATIAPRFLDRIYYRGPESAHYDGARFFNPDGDDTLRPPGSGNRGGFFWRYITGSDGRPPWPSRVDVAQAKPAARVTGDTMVATWVGHATVLVQTQGLNILTDPIWSENAGPFGQGPRRVARPGIAFYDLPPIDLIVVSHNHYDHMDLTTLKRLWDRDRPLIVTSLGNDTILRSAGIEARGLDWGSAVPIGPDADTRAPLAKVIVTRNHHWGSRWFADRNRALWSSFVVTLPGGNLFFAGDTGFGDGSWADEAASYGPIRLAIVPIGAFRFQPGQMGIGSHIGPVDAVEVYRRLGASHGLPIHWGTFRLSYEAYMTPPRLLMAATRCTTQVGFTPSAIGVPRSIPAYRPSSPRSAMPRDALLACLDRSDVHALQ